MNHPEARYLLADWRAGNLASVKAEEVAAHADGCEVCGPIVETYDLLRDAAVGAAHPATDRLVAMALGAAMESDEERHLERCSPCRDAVEQVRKAEAGRDGRSRRSRRASRVLTPLAAAAALILVAFLAGRLSLDPGTSGTAPTGVTLYELPLMRGAQRTLTHETILAREGRLELALAPSIPDNLADTHRLEFVWSADAKAPAHRTTLTAGELRQLSAGSGALRITLPVDGLDEGSGRLQLKSISDGETWLDTPVSWRVSNDE